MERDEQHEAADTGEETSPRQLSAQHVVSSYLKERNVVEFLRLQELRQKGWENPDADRAFARQRRAADNANQHTVIYFFRMMTDIAKEMDKACDAFSPSRPGESLTALDTCLAPGGYVQYLLNEDRVSSVKALTLPPKDGGHGVLIQSPKLSVEFLDVTMLAGEMGLPASEIPPSHPDAANFVMKRVIEADQKFNLAICDGQILRTQPRLPWRDLREARRLTTMQLFLALGHIQVGGTMIVLLHRAEMLENIELFQAFSKFSGVQLYKPKRAHCHRSSFYMVAKNIQPDHAQAKQLFTKWRDSWRVSTFGTDEEYKSLIWKSPQHAQALLDEFGETFVGMAKDIWGAQAAALSRKKWAN